VVEVAVEVALPEQNHHPNHHHLQAFHPLQHDKIIQNQSAHPLVRRAEEKEMGENQETIE